MTILLDNYTLPEKGHVQIHVSFDIIVTAHEARQKARRWLMEEVSTQIDADLPTLVVGERILWRAPAYISFPDTGRIDQVLGMVTIDAKTGELIDLPLCKAEILKCLEEKVKPKLPLDKFVARKVSPQFIPTDIPQAEKITLPKK